MKLPRRVRGHGGSRCPPLPAGLWVAPARPGSRNCRAQQTNSVHGPPVRFEIIRLWLRVGPSARQTRATTDRI